MYSSGSLLFIVTAELNSLGTKEIMLKINISCETYIFLIDTDLVFSYKFTACCYITFSECFIIMIVLGTYEKIKTYYNVVQVKTIFVALGI